MPVLLSVAPPDGFESWAAADWDAWFSTTQLDQAEPLAERSEWIVFLYMSRVHGKAAQSELAPFLERLIIEKPFSSREVRRLREAFQDLRRVLETVPAGRLWTGTQFYTPQYLFDLVQRKEQETGRFGQELKIADLWRPLFTSLEAVLERAEQAGRGVYFGHVGV